MELFWATENTFDAAFLKLQQLPPLEPFAIEVRDFTAALSKELLTYRSQPEIVALGYWLRKANIEKMATEFERGSNKSIKIARGTVFHIAPSNVDTIFVYSWILSLLAGNRNIIRISSKSAETNLLQTIIELFKQIKFKNIAERTILCTYAHNEGITEKVSLACHTRVVWGGDATIKAIRTVPLAPLANELTFPDRFSLSVMMTEKLADAQDLFAAFYNDTYWFDQMACSSPRMIFWLGKNRDEVEHFWQSFNQYVASKSYVVQPALQVEKLATAFELATLQETRNIITTPQFTRIEIEQLTKEHRELHCGAGLFLECYVDSVEELAKQLIDKDQTLSYYGVSKNELQQLVCCLTNRAIDRIVPIGQALNFDRVWDGQNFLTSFTREVTLL